jgi:SAM-dependent methyltransferase
MIPTARPGLRPRPALNSDPRDRMLAAHMAGTEYDEQHRGDHGAYDRYLAAMDAAMKVKVAQTAAHLLGQGRVADMGMGSGTGSHALASLYPGLQVTGVDVSREMVERAGERYADLPNLRFVVGDIAQRCFEPASLIGIFNSSVMHHVTTFNDYDHDAVRRALEVQVEALEPLGVVIVRDFLDPGPGEVLLDLPAEDGQGDPAADPPLDCSTADLFERFAREFRPLAEGGQRGFVYERVEGAPAGWRRYRVARRMAVELLLRKDYRADWATEILEEYTYYTQERFEEVYAALGLRVLASTPIVNPWIVRHRLRGKFGWTDLQGAPLELPATNYIVVGERVPAGQGVLLREGQERAPLGFLELTHQRHKETGKVLDLVRRPHLTVDCLPWFEADGDLFVLARKSYPRPILTCRLRGTVPVDGARAVGYVTEPLAVLQDDKPLGQTVEEALAARFSVPGARLRAFREGGRYFPSPGGIQEEVRALLVEMDPLFVETSIDNVSGFSTSGLVRALEARQVLRAAQVGGLPSARLEVNVYDLLRGLGRDPGAWIGEEIALAEAAAPPARSASMVELAGRPARRAFEPADPADSSGFLELATSEFEELDAAGQVLHARSLEFVVPRPLSFNTVAVAPLLRRGDEVYLGLDDDDLPAAQNFSGNSQLLVAPAWRLPREVTSPTPARAWVVERMASEYGVGAGQVWELGGHYHPSPGVTPEVVYPLAVEVLEQRGSAPRELTWVRLQDALDHLEELCDGHLRLVALRASHALGLLSGRRETT